MGYPFPQRGEGGQGEGSFWGGCARGVGIEKALSVRKWIESVRYTKKTIGVDFVLVGSETEKQEATTTERGDVPAVRSTEKDPMECDSTPSARSWKMEKF
ncbi:MAG: hypothetical protein IPN90_00520 [Elusimicrobia bacterium]|nr:hypothetical protein [Elusimicrobiota bacterium]